MSAVPKPERSPHVTRFAEYDPDRKWRVTKYVSAVVAFCIALAAFAWGVLSEGLRVNFVPSAIPLARWKGVPSWMQGLDFMHRLDAAAPAAVLLAFAAWWSYDFFLRKQLEDPESIPIRQRQRQEKYDPVGKLLATVIIIVDGWVFYSALVSMGWAGSFSFTALIAAAGYAALLGWLSLMLLNLRLDIDT